nr:hypothetical protein [Tanacetum cinerariifolium]
MVAAAEPITIHMAVQKARTLTDKAIRNGSLKKNPEKRKNGGEPNRDRNDYRVAPRMVNPVNARNPTVAPRVCYEYGGTDHFKAACPTLNQAQRPRETVQTKLLLLMGDKVVGTTATRHVEGRLYWEQRRLARTRTS